MKILVSGFEVFDGFKVNPSEQLVKALQEKDFSFELETAILPVSFQNSFKILKQSINDFKPDYVIGFGLAELRGQITIERVAVNLMEARIPDNDGRRPRDEAVESDCPDGLFASLPIKTMMEACKNAGVPCSISNTAGTYVCNYLMYKIISDGLKAGYKGGFVHLPPTPDLPVNGKTMELERIVAGVSAMLMALDELS